MTKPELQQNDPVLGPEVSDAPAAGAPTAADAPSCDHPVALGRAALPAHTLERAARIFQSLGDPGRLRVLSILVEGEMCVSEIAAFLGEEISTVSHRLRLLRAEGIVNRRREGRHIHYSLLDGHVVELMKNALDHAEEESSAH